MLSGIKIRQLIDGGAIKIEPFDDILVRENGVDMRIGDEIAVLLNNPEPIDPENLTKTNLNEYYKIVKLDGDFVLQPYMKILATTLEYIELPANIGAFVELRSTFARLGLSIPPTIIDAGFKGQITLEIHGGAFPVKLKKGLRFAHIVFLPIIGEPIPYRGKYSGQRGVTLPK
ncbi:MAG: dCTP deaminase [Candidatus Aenigmatarchaeota archaeon]|nr:MAG: dCTP deaminase [Candidatus Aenigmarchaeota archaeon]